VTAVLAVRAGRLVGAVQARLLVALVHLGLVVVTEARARGGLVRARVHVRVGVAVDVRIAAVAGVGRAAHAGGAGAGRAADGATRAARIGARVAGITTGHRRAGARARDRAMIRRGPLRAGADVGRARLVRGRRLVTRDRVRRPAARRVLALPRRRR